MLGNKLTSQTVVAQNGCWRASAASLCNRDGAAQSRRAIPDCGRRDSWPANHDGACSCHQRAKSSHLLVQLATSRRLVSAILPSSHHVLWSFRQWPPHFDDGLASVQAERWGGNFAAAWHCHCASDGQRACGAQLDLLNWRGTIGASFSQRVRSRHEPVLTVWLQHRPWLCIVCWPPHCLCNPTAGICVSDSKRYHARVADHSRSPASDRTLATALASKLRNAAGGKPARIASCSDHLGACF